ncbi:MAG: tRNA epoxyqueuosine(34) reductase QueG [Alphaproteobacteria bacterium]|nr:MAG: tRNA epoxyqueuosine(34) reductase QueG [Alphaproteobacteria bacterium]
MTDERTKEEQIRHAARACGFDAVGFTTPDGLGPAAGRLDRFLALGRHGDMAWLATRAECRRDPRALWPEVRSIIMLGMNYGPEGDPLAPLALPDAGTISVYARNRDYHDLVKKRLKALGRWIAHEFGTELKVFVDTAPVMEKPLAAAAGLGWQGKHTNLVSRDFGSWLFLGAIFTTLELIPDATHRDHCGSCRRCLDICPTDAFPAPYELDARRCISYLTIEHKGHIPRALRPAIGNRIYGCDDCLAVCPWNRFAQRAREAAFHARQELVAPPLERLVALDDAAFRALFTKSPIKRTGRNRFVRNVLIAIGNSARPEFVPAVRARLSDASPLVRAMAVWALHRLSPAQARKERSRHLAEERDAAVRAEWAALDVDGDGGSEAAQEAP